MKINIKYLVMTGIFCGIASMLPMFSSMVDTIPAILAPLFGLGLAGVGPFAPKEFPPITSQVPDFRPEFISPPLPDTTGIIQEGLEGLPERPGGAGLQSLRNQALQQGPSNFARLQGQASQSNIAQQTAGLTATARSNLASRGGLSSGARERIASTGITSGLIAGQQARSGIAQADEVNRLGLLRALPGQELAQFSTISKEARDRASLLGTAVGFDANAAFKAAQEENIFNISEADRQARKDAALIEAQGVAQSGGKK